MIIDSFAGGGGASTGIEMALGRAPDVAINHSADALALHAANHPDTLHLDSNIWDVDPLAVTQGRKVGLLWASPDCKHFSKAKGAAPRDRNIRDLAWVVVRWAEQARPDVIIMENVEEFVTWGPLDDTGRPIEWLRGHTFGFWVAQLRKAGYRVQWREMRACDYGAPTIRKRWFLIARRDGQRIVWPKPTHGAPDSTGVRSGRLKPWRTAAECIDWSLPCPSIFDTSAQIMERHGLRAVRPLAAATMARIARGMKRYVIDAEQPFILHLKGSARNARGSDAPAPTVMAGGGHQAVIAPYLATMRNSQKPWQEADKPTHTITAGGAGLTLCSPYLASIAHGDSGGRREYPLADPLGTVTGAGVQHALIAPVLTYAQQGGACRPADAPHSTICASRKDQNAVMAASVIRHFGASIGHAADHPLGTVTAGGGGKSGLIAASLIQTGYGEAPGQQPRTLDLQAPLGTVVAGGIKHAPFAAFLAQQNTGVTGHDAREPLSTIIGSGSHQTPVAAWFAKYYGTGDGSTMDAPCHTVTVKDRFGHMQAALQAPPFGPEHQTRARAVADFLRAHDAWDDREFVTLHIGGADYVVIDIGLRMLTPRELFNAQGFPPDYVIEGVWDRRGDDWVWRAFPNNTQVSCCGNSVCPPLAAALVSANCAHLAAAEGAAGARAHG